MASVIIFVILRDNNPVPWCSELPQPKTKQQLFVVIQRKVIFFLPSGEKTIRTLAIFTSTSVIFIFDVFSYTMNHHAIHTCHNVHNTYVMRQSRKNYHFFAMNVISRPDRGVFKKKASFTTKFATESHPNGF